MFGKDLRIEKELNLEKTKFVSGQNICRNVSAKRLGKRVEWNFFKYKN